MTKHPSHTYTFGVRKRTDKTRHDKTPHNNDSNNDSRCIQQQGIPINFRVFEFQNQKRKRIQESGKDGH